MADEPTPDGTAMPVDDAPDAFFGRPEDQEPSEFWEEADARHGGKDRRRRHRAPRAGAAAAAAHPAPAARPPSGIRSRVAAAWAAEASARRALRGRKAGANGPVPADRRRRKVAAGIIGAVALVAVALAVTEASWRDAATTDSAEASGATTDGSGGSDASSASSGSSYDAQTADAAVESEIVDAPRSRQTTAKSRAKTTTTTAAPKSQVADPAAPKLPKPGSSGPSAPKPTTPAPATPAPTTVAPPTTAPPTPTTTTPRPPAAPTVQTFTAKAATSAGGACPPLQWATTFTWATTNASTVDITGLLETTQANLPGDGSRVVCRLLPGGPLGGWTLTATGPGGRTTASA
ncbi:MAG: hypothetical protein ACTHN0_07890 [Aquihabitans sp.]